MPSSKENARGILSMNFGMFGFIGSDTLVKYLTQTLPLGETIFLRGLFACTIVAAVLIWTGSWRAWRQVLTVRMGFRVIGEMGSTVLYLAALVHMPIANATAVFQVNPLIMTVGAALFLGEKVGPRRWTAVALGFVGVMIIVRPGLAGFDAWSLAVIAAVLFVALRDLVTARLPSGLPNSLVLFATALSATVLGPMLIPFEHLVGARTEWVMPDAHLVGLAALNAVSLLGGYLGLLLATRLAETSAIAPFRYMLLVWAFLFGVVVFGQFPDVPTLVGTAIVVSTGLYAFHRERRVREAQRAAREG